MRWEPETSVLILPQFDWPVYGNLFELRDDCFPYLMFLLNRKNWTQSWTVLHGGILTFHKDPKFAPAGYTVRTILTVLIHPTFIMTLLGHFQSSNASFKLSSMGQSDRHFVCHFVCFHCKIGPFNQLVPHRSVVAPWDNGMVRLGWIYCRHTTQSTEWGTEKHHCLNHICCRTRMTQC